MTIRLWLSVILPAIWLVYFLLKRRCKHEYKTILWYKTVPDKWSNYAINTYKTQVCTRCGKVKTQKNGKYSEIFRDMFQYKIRMLESQGYITEREYLDKVQRISEN